MLVVAHDIVSMNTSRQLGINTKEKTKSSEKLSSGYKINRSADDAAGLQISEKMRIQIRGLNRASDNIQDGMSLVQVADGALNETHDILHRMKELCVQAANDVNTSDERQVIQEELDQLKSEVDRIAKTTTFNEDVYPLLGGVYNPDIQPDDIQFIKGVGLAGRRFEVGATNCVINGKTYRPGDTFGVIGLWPWSKNKNQILMDTYTFDVTQPVVSGVSANLITALYLDDDGFVFYEDKTYQRKHYIGWDANGDFFGSENKAAFAELVTLENLERENFIEEKGVKLQVGAKAGQELELDMVKADSSNIGINEVCVFSQEMASDALELVDKAVDRVSTFRSKFGAYQNRLEYAQAVDDNTSENTQAAESRIRDLDMADEMVQYSKHNILEQAGQSMLAQTSKLNARVVDLLGG